MFSRLSIHSHFSSLCPAIQNISLGHSLEFSRFTRKRNFGQEKLKWHEMFGIRFRIGCYKQRPGYPDAELRLPTPIFSMAPRKFSRKLLRSVLFYIKHVGDSSMNFRTTHSRDAGFATSARDHRWARLDPEEENFEERVLFCLEVQLSSSTFPIRQLTISRIKQLPVPIFDEVGRRNSW